MSKPCTQTLHHLCATCHTICSEELLLKPSCLLLTEEVSLLPIGKSSWPLELEMTSTLARMNSLFEALRRPYVASWRNNLASSLSLCNWKTYSGSSLYPSLALWSLSASNFAAVSSNYPRNSHCWLSVVGFSIYASTSSYNLQLGLQ